MQCVLQQLSKAEKELENQVLQMNSSFVICTPARTRGLDGNLACWPPIS